MTNGLGASIGVIAAQEVVNHFATSIEGWSTAWYIFAAYACVVGVLFALLFKDKKTVASE
jgi:sugar phosphate permease